MWIKPSVSFQAGAFTGKKRFFTDEKVHAT
jgi:hypothetical protein